MKFVLVLLGGGIGSLIRYSVSGWVHGKYSGVFPLGTLTVNLAGSFLIGVLWALFESATMSPTLRVFLFVGILGGFTTFSTFSLETLSLLRDGEVRTALLNILVNNVGGILLAFAGFSATREVQQLITKL
ncbi:MAG: fluoride efflux transporter CrcB [Flammeovirgaceae bacterium]|nr:MAG: fluoride efflux transporter CrcB [Flammeovirgaceae bacterium]